MSNEIKIKPEAARAAAVRMRNKAREIEGLLNTQRSDVNNYFSFWGGEARQRYVERYREIEATYREVPRELRRQAIELDEIARAKERADRRRI